MDLKNKNRSHGLISSMASLHLLPSSSQWWHWWVLQGPGCSKPDRRVIFLLRTFLFVWAIAKAFIPIPPVISRSCCSPRTSMPDSDDPMLLPLLSCSLSSVLGEGRGLAAPRSARWGEETRGPGQWKLFHLNLCALDRTLEALQVVQSFQTERIFNKCLLYRTSSYLKY